MNEKFEFSKVTPEVIAVSLLALEIFPLPFGNYHLPFFLGTLPIFAVLIYLAKQAHTSNRLTWMYVFIGAAILSSPLILVLGPIGILTNIAIISLIVRYARLKGLPPLQTPSSLQTSRRASTRSLLLMGSYVAGFGCMSWLFISAGQHAPNSVHSWNLILLFLGGPLLVILSVPLLIVLPYIYHKHRKRKEPDFSRADAYSVVFVVWSLLAIFSIDTCLLVIRLKLGAAGLLGHAKDSLWR
jgi:hypothetical protein